MDIPMVNKIFTALVSFLLTVVPIIMTMHRASATATAVAAEDACSLSAPLVTTIQGVMMGMGNAACSYNVTLNEIMGM